jgi:hypothetical protein
VVLLLVPEEHLMTLWLAFCALVYLVSTWED